MTTKKRGLGRGLDALLGGAMTGSEDGGNREQQRDEATRQLAVTQLRPGRFQPRKEINSDKLRELADSISAQGIVQPIVVRPLPEGQYEIIAGERRWRAAQLAGLQDVPVIVRQINDQAALAIALIENIQREDLNPLEEAEALQRLVAEFDLTHQQVADAVGRSRVAVTNILRLNELEDELKDMLLRGDIEMGHARALLGLNEEAQVIAANKVVARKLTVRATEALVQEMKEEKKGSETERRDPDIRRLEENLATRIGAQVMIRHGNKGNGKLIIQYDSLDQLEGVLERIR